MDTDEGHLLHHEPSVPIVPTRANAWALLGGVVAPSGTLDLARVMDVMNCVRPKYVLGSWSSW